MTPQKRVHTRKFNLHIGGNRAAFYSIWRHRVRRLLVMGCLAMALRAADENKAASTAKPADGALQQQRQAISQMEVSLEAQRQAIRKQTGQTAPQKFFLLPPPPHNPLTGAPLPECDPLPQTDVDSLVTEAATRAQLNPDLLRSVMQQESAFRPCAVSSKGAMGLMQLMPSTAAEFGATDPFNPRDNVDAGARFLKELLNLYGGDVPLALGAYNAGPARVNEAGGIPMIPQTVDYIRRVLLLMPPLQ